MSKKEAFGKRRRSIRMTRNRGAVTISTPHLKRIEMVTKLIVFVPKSRVNKNNLVKRIET